MAEPGLIFAPQRTGEVRISTGGKKKTRGLWSPTLIWVVGLLVIVIIIIILILLLLTSEQEIIVVNVDEDVVNLDNLIDAQNADCCLQPDQIIPTENWLFESGIGYTIGIEPISCDLVCDGLVGSNLTTCQNICQGPDGLPKPVAHKGIKVYYAFAPTNMVPSICQSFVPCP